MSTARNWTDAQRRAIETIDRRVLVSAAAGSGKTAVLSERCAHLVCSASEAQRCGVDELLVVTFTEAAAAEMKGRIARAIRTRAERGDDPHVVRQLAEIERANVSTLHSFCSRLLRQHFHVAGIDPAFDVIDGDEAFLLRREVVDQIISDAYENDDDGAVQRLVDGCFDGNDGRLAELVLSTHELLSSLVFPDKWLATARRRIREAADGPVDQSDFAKVYVGELRTALAALRAQCEQTHRSVRAMPGLDAYVQHIAELGGITKQWTDAFTSDGLDALAEVAAADLPRTPTIRGPVPGKDQAKALIDALKKRMGGEGLGRKLRFTWSQWQRGMAGTVEPCEVVLSLVERFAGAYRQAKDEIRSLDFSDLERLALRVLTEPGSDPVRPSAIARSYHRRYKHVLVDEYQDINQLQDTLLRLLSRECVDGAKANLFCVGDVKQSIYRFRLANPRLFQNRRKALSTNGNDGVIDLRENFRSRAPLLGCVNAVFERLMSQDLDDLPYDEAQRLVPGAAFPGGGFTGAPVELHLLPDSPDENGDDDADDLERIEREAWIAVSRIRELVQSKAQVTDRKDPAAPTLRDLAFGDIAILLRARRYKADQFASVLRQAGIPVHAEGGTGFFNAQEIRDMLALLHVLDNPRQDVPLAALLRSPLIGLPRADDSLARIRLAYPVKQESPRLSPGLPDGTSTTTPADGPVPFHRAVVLYGMDKDDELAAFLRSTLNRIDRWREMAQTRPLAEVIWAIYHETGYPVYCAGLPDGRQRRANLMLLHRRAAQFDSFRRQGLARFIGFLDSLERETDTGQAPVATEAGDAVRIMTIHESKGLEFPVVIVPDIGKAINLKDCQGPVLIHREAGIGMMTADFERQARYPSLTWTVIEARHRQASMAEELRVLYVAMTRAKEHLILISTGKADAVEQWQTRWGSHVGALPVDYVVGSRSMLDWLGPIAVSTTNLPNPPIEIIPHTTIDKQPAPSARTLPADAAFHRLANLEPLTPTPPADELATEMVARLNHRYPHEPLTRIAAAQSVTSIAHRDRSRSSMDVPMSQASTVPAPIESLAKPRFVDTTTAPTDVGTATHVVLQHLRLDNPDVEAQIAGMVDRHVLRPEQAALVDRAAVRWFASTDLGRRMARAGDRILRELPIYLALPAPGQVTDDDQIMLRGRLDALVLDDEDGDIIVDYKTDNVTLATVQRRTEEYRSQMTFYAQAIERIRGRRPASVYLVFLTPRHIMAVE